MAQRTRDVDAVLVAIDAASPDMTRARLAAGRATIQAWVSATMSRDHADAALSDVHTEDRRWVALMSLCADLCADGADASEVIDAYAGGMIESDELEFDADDIARLRHALLP